MYYSVNPTYIFILPNDQMPQTDAWIKIEVTHRQGCLKNIPKSLLCILQKEIRIERQLTLGQSLKNTDLKLNIRVARSDLLSDGNTSDEIVVLKEGKIGLFIQDSSHAIRIINLLSSFGQYLCLTPATYQPNQPTDDQNPSHTFILLLFFVICRQR